MIKVSTCFAKFGTKNNEIKWAIAVFPDHRPKDHMRACVVEELTQVLGLPNDSAQVAPSIFNDKSATSSSPNTTAGCYKCFTTRVSSWACRAKKPFRRTV